jgi:hypothetical protein
MIYDIIAEKVHVLVFGSAPCQKRFEQVGGTTAAPVHDFEKEVASTLNASTWVCTRVQQQHHQGGRIPFQGLAPLHPITAAGAAWPVK